MLAGHVTMTEVNEGLVDVEDLLKLNALMDMVDATQQAAMDKAAAQARNK